jgi:hypothetical protein
MEGDGMWSDQVDEILGGDQALLLAYATPAKGVVLTPVTNFGLRDREAGTVTLLTSIGMWKKLHRMQQDPHVALAFHTRRHGFSERPEYVLVQGRASFSWEPDRPWLESIEEPWRKFMGPRDLGPLWDRWLRVYLWERVGVTVEVERAVVWEDLRASGVPRVLGAPLPREAPAPQREPAKGTGPRVDHGRVAARAERLPDVLLGWVGADGFPVAVPVGVDGVEPGRIVLRAPAAAVPPGGRRAGLTAHAFTREVLGQDQRVHTGWMEAGAGGRIVYAPHTESSYRLPPSKLLYRLAAGFVTRRRLRQGRRQGVVPPAAPRRPPRG